MTETAPQNIGARLRLAREQSGLSLRQLADATKLSVRAFESLERGHINNLPGGIYRRAIVRAYASEIGLEPEAAVRAFLAQYPDDLPAPPIKQIETDSWGHALPSAAPPPQRQRGTLQTVLGILGALVPILAGIFYFASTARGAAEVNQPTDGGTMPAVLRAEIVPISGLLGSSPLQGRPVSMMISVSSACLLQIVADGEEVTRGRLEPGERLEIELVRDLVLLGDDAGAVQFSINGRASRKLGDAGAPLNALISRDNYEEFLVRPQ
jgi:transcriptional regulator with XRE-family HTH domain